MDRREYVATSNKINNKLTNQECKYRYEANIKDANMKLRETQEVPGHLYLNHAQAPYSHHV